MFSERCKTVVREELKKLGLHFKLMDLGEVDVMEDLTPAEREQLAAGLVLSGLELMEDKRGNLLEKVKATIIELVYSDDNLERYTFTSFLTERIGGDYMRMSEVFSEMQGISIQHYFIGLKAERVKELIMDGDLNLTEIAFKMQYSSVGHLSNQFKKVTGHSPSHFKTIRAMWAAAEKIESDHDTF